jgi:SHS2 domain-containing protein
MPYNYTKTMQKNALSGYKERPHTADWALDVWGTDFLMLLKQAAIGMFALIDGHLKDGSRQWRHLSLIEPDRETLLVSFLSELVYLNESEQLGFDRFQLSLRGLALEVDLEGGIIVGQAKQIKAVTYHNLEIRNTTGGCETTIVFDV